MSSLPRYVTRSEWGAAPPRTRPVLLLPSAVDTIVYHYTAADSDEQLKHDHCAARVKGIQHYHTHPTPQDPTKPWNDIAYNFLVCKHGYVFEGRGLEAKSAATGTANSHTLAVCFLGDDTVGRDDVTAAGRQALVDITRSIRMRRPTAKLLAGHRDFMNTTCPGNELWTYIHSKTFERQLTVDEKAELRKWILARVAEGWGWKRVKATRQWRRFRALGGR